MIELRLALPSVKDREAVLDYKREFLENGDSMDGTSALAASKTFEGWLSSNIANRREETVAPGLVPASTYLAYAGERLVGMIDLRHRLNEHLLNFGGHIGYSVRKSERRKGYATEMLRLVLPYAWQLGLDRVLITCNQQNEGSRRTILQNGGVLENEVPRADGITQRYWILKP
ncbi:MAG: GNAT family N-acetyltransferase [Eubacteriales bacterium]|nr:GNAT family N-acetyltransferase [Eubacteriales bacterium]